MQEIQKADPRARKKVLMVIVCATVVGAALILLAESQLEALKAWIIQDPSLIYSRVRLTMGVLAAVLLATTVGFAAYLWRIGARIIRAGRFPTPEMSVLRDTVVVHGPSARRRGRLLQWLGVFLFLATAGLVLALWLLVSLLGSPAA